MTRRSLAPLCAAALAIAVVVAAPGRAQDDDPPLSPAARTALELMNRADEELKAKKHDDAVKSYARLLEHLDEIEKKKEGPDFPPSQRKVVRYHAHYNTACALALLGKRADALAALERAVDAGFYDWQHLEKDDDLASVRDEAKVKELVQRMRGQDKETQRLAAFVKQSVSAKEKALFPFDFEVTTLDKEKLKLADLKGKVVVVDCFGTWCPPCREEVPSFTKLHRQVKERGEPVVIVGLAWERADPNEAVEKTVREFAEENKIQYPIALMKEKDPVLDRIPELRAFPTTLWIDRDGKVRARLEGLHSFEELEAVTKHLVQEGTKPPPEKKPAEGKAPEGEKKPAKPEAEEPF